MLVVVAKGNLGEMVGRGLPHVVAGSECRDMSAHQRREVHHHSGHRESDCQPCVKGRATRFAPLRSHCDKLRHDKPDAHKGHHSKQRMQTRQGAAHHGEDFVRPCEVKQPEQRMLFENIGETFLGIAFVEMKHFDRLGDFIGQLGGRVNTPKYSSSAVTVEYESAAEAVRVNIQAEKDTIAAYQQLIERIRKNNPEKLTQSATVAIQLLNKIVSDERVHVRILSELAQSVAAEEGKEA